jgi:hypothetical protein
MINFQISSKEICGQQQGILGRATASGRAAAGRDALALPWYLSLLPGYCDFYALWKLA